MELEELLELIKKGEWVNLEFKEKPVALGEEIVALANAEGGKILVGVSDKGKIEGCEPKKAMEILNSVLQSLSPLPRIRTEVVKVGQKKILVIDVEKSPSLVTTGSLAYVRIGTSKRPLSIQEIFSLGVEKGEFRWDEQPSRVESSKASRELMDSFFERMQKVRGRKVNRLDYLKSIKAVKKKNNRIYLTNGGLLFFTEEPQIYFPNSGVRIITVDEKGEPVKQIEFRGNLWRLADQITEWLERNLGYVEVKIGAGVERILEYPFKALREAIINALLHRNYSLESDIRLFVHPDRIRIRSPGGLMPGVNLDEPEHVPRNPLLCQLMFDIGYTEKYGYGIKMMRDLTKAHPIAQLNFEFDTFRFDVMFSKEKYFGIIEDLDRKILMILREGPKSSSEIASLTKLSKPTVIARIKKMMSLGLIKVIGRGPKTVYSLS